MGFTVEFDSRSAKRFFDDVHNAAVKKAMPSTLNKTRDKTMTFLRKDMNSKFGIKAGVVNSRTKKEEAKASSLVATIEMYGRTPNVKSFSTKKTKIGISHGAFGKRKNVKGAFFHPNGAVLKRTGKSRLPIEPVYGRNPKRAFGANKNMSRYQRFARANIGDIFENQYKFFASRIRRKKR